MTEIRQWAYAVTISAIVGAIILSVTPGGSTEKLVRAAVSLFLMCAILSPFLKGADPMKLINGIEIPETQSSKADGNETAEYLQDMTKEKISDILIECAIKNADISISINIENGNEMKIENVSVKAEKEYENYFENAEKNLKARLGIEVKIEVKE